MVKKISTLCALIIALSAVLGLVYTLDGRWAKAADVALVAQRLDDKISSDRADRIQEKVWTLEDRNKGKVMQGMDLQLYRELTKELNELNQKMKKSK